MLQLVVTAELMRRHPRASEGDLAWMRQGVVQGATCAAVARAARLPEALVAMAPPSAREPALVIGARESVQAAVAEAVIGGAWLDLGPGVTEQAALDAFAPALDAAVPGARDPKTTLQEEAARRSIAVAYELVAQEGPPHARTFETRAVVGGRPLGVGRGASKRSSEVAAARAALQRLAGAAEDRHARGRGTAAPEC